MSGYREQQLAPDWIGGQATDLGQPGTYLFFGECRPDETADWFKVASSGGTVESSIHVTPPPAGGGGFSRGGSASGGTSP